MTGYHPPIHHGRRMVLLAFVFIILISIPHSSSTAFCPVGSYTANKYLLPFTSSSTTATARTTRATTTALQVSELHIPGYAKSKLPFILKPEHLLEQEPHKLSSQGGGGGATTATRRQLNVLQYSSSDYTSSIPYQDGFLLHTTKNNPILTADECQGIIDEAEHIAALQSWTTTRHGNYPTTDLPLLELPQTLSFLRLTLVERIYPLLQSQFGASYLPDATKLRLADGFVVKYDAAAGGQTELKPHRDGSVLSFNIALNSASEFTGGGTWFASLQDAIRIDQGEIVSHASALLHGGHGITSGRRYILVGFVILEGYDSWSMRFYNQVRNL
jgi:hypothetical protein